MTRQQRRAWLEANDIELLQFGDELDKLHAYYMSRSVGSCWPAKSLVEIGVWQGGTMFMLAEYLAAGATIIGIDPGATDENHRKAMRVATELVRQGFDAHVLRRVSDRALRTVTALLDLHQRKIELLHIDGAHSYAGVSSDFTKYSPLVVRGGVIQLHDVVNVDPKTGKDYGTKQFWEEISPRYKERHVFANSSGGRVPGIGVLVTQ